MSGKMVNREILIAAVLIIVGVTLTAWMAYDAIYGSQSINQENYDEYQEWCQSIEGGETELDVVKLTESVDEYGRHRLNWTVEKNVTVTCADNYSTWAEMNRQSFFDGPPYPWRVRGIFSFLGLWMVSAGLWIIAGFHPVEWSI